MINLKLNSFVLAFLLTFSCFWGTSLF